MQKRSAPRPWASSTEQTPDGWLVTGKGPRRLILAIGGTLKEADDTWHATARKQSLECARRQRFSLRGAVSGVTTGRWYGGKGIIKEVTRRG